MSWKSTVLILLVAAFCAKDAKAAETLHDPYNLLLREYVVGGLVDYDRLHRSQGDVDVLSRYIHALEKVDPETFESEHALAYWLNLYNAGALRLAAVAFAAGEESVLRVPGAFNEPFVSVAGEELSLDAIEHAKIRRFGDPRIHSAIVCGSVSCPTLRVEPYDGQRLDAQLDDQMRHFLTSDGAQVADGRLMLSRVFLWYGADFVRPGRMPTWIPASRKRVAAALRPWLAESVVGQLDGSPSSIEYQPYDWGLRCAVG